MPARAGSPVARGERVAAVLVRTVVTRGHIWHGVVLLVGMRAGIGSRYSSDRARSRISATVPCRPPWTSYPPSSALFRA